MSLTAARAREVLSYNATTGDVVWLLGRRKGKQAGQATTQWPQVRIDGTLYGLHRVIWLMVTGAWPALSVDHKDRNPRHNWWTNLREATQEVQTQNRDMPAGVSGLLGAVRNGAAYQARIMVAGKRHNLGRFATPEAANAAYSQARKEHHSYVTVSKPQASRVQQPQCQGTSSHQVGGALPPS